MNRKVCFTVLSLKTINRHAAQNRCMKRQKKIATAQLSIMCLRKFEVNHISPQLLCQLSQQLAQKRFSQQISSQYFKLEVCKLCNIALHYCISQDCFFKSENFIPVKILRLRNSIFRSFNQTKFWVSQRSMLTVSL